MEYTTLGSTGMEVSRVCLGCMSFGDASEWMLDEADSREIIDRAVDLGVNFFDTANVYSRGGSERILGNALSGYDRDRMVVATKVWGTMDPDNPNSGGLSRKAIEQELDASRERLGMDTVDLYQIHRWDYETPIEETLRALDDAVRRGKIRYPGASSMWTRQFAEALHTAERLGLERFQTMQNQYSLAYREEEREMLPYCDGQGVGVIPWSPLARGFLARPHEELDSTTRGRTDTYGGETHDWHDTVPYADAGGLAINERVEELAADEGATMAQIALAWLFHKEWVDAPIVGTTSVEHLEDAVDALDISLSDSDLAFLEEPYEPVEPSGLNRR